jgi:hypothetical protein
MSAQKPRNRFNTEELRRAREEELNRECTFQPRTSASSSVRPRTAIATSERLFREAEELRRRRESQQLAKENEVVADCTFQPSIRRDAARPRSASAVRASNRLYDEAARRKQKLEVSQKALREAEIASYPFRPRLNAESEALVEGTAHKPLQERIADIQRSRDERLTKLKLDAELDNPDLTFRPRLISRSGGEQLSEAASMSSATESVSERVTRRLSHEAVEAHRRHTERQRKWQEAQEAAHSFKPDILPKSRQLAARTEMGEASFLERQRMFESEKV